MNVTNQWQIMLDNEFLCSTKQNYLALHCAYVNVANVIKAVTEFLSSCLWPYNPYGFSPDDFGVWTLDDHRWTRDQLQFCGSDTKR